MQRHIAQHLLNIGAVSLSPNKPFTWASGLKAPIYCDNRLTMSYPVVRSDIANGLVALIKTHYPEVEVIAGTATAGIPHAAWVSERLDLPMVYVRSKAKAHGQGNQIEGRISVGQKVVIVEDLISTASSALTTAKALGEQGCDVLGVVAIFSYQLPQATKNCQQAALSFHTLSNYSTLLQVALDNKQINSEQHQQLNRWNAAPEKWQAAE